MFQKVSLDKEYINTSYHVQYIYNASRLFATKYYLVPQDGSRSTSWLSEFNLRPVAQKHMKLENKW